MRLGGVPAKVIKYRFDEECIKKMLDLDFSNVDQKWISDRKNLLLNNITSVSDIDFID